MKKLLVACIATGLGGGAIPIGSEHVAHADAFTTGSLRGVVRDTKSGDPTIGATVVATSSALQGEQVVIADENGAYFITSLPPGNYTLTVYYNEATFARRDVLVQVGKEAVVNISIDTGASKGETIEIKGAAPIVDQGSSKIGVTITSDYTNNVPAPRTFGDVMGRAGGAQSDQYGVSFAGATSAENTYIVEGLNTTDTGFGILSSNLPNEFIQETEVITGGYNAEFGRATGAIVNVVTKSGSNDLHGSVFGHLQTKALTASAEKILREGTAIDRATNQDYKYDFGAELGGPLIKDKLWFHVGFTPTVQHTTTTRIINTNVDADGDGVPDIDPRTGFTVRDEVDSSEIPSSYKTYFFTAKLTGAISQNHRWQITAFGNPETDQAADPTNLGFVRNPATTREKTDTGAYDVSAKWTSKWNDGKTQFDAVIGYHNGFKNTQPLSPAQDVPGITYEFTRSLYDFQDIEGGTRIGRCDDVSPMDPYPKIQNCPVLGYTDQGLGFLENRTNDRTSAVLALTQHVKALGQQHVFKVGLDAEFSTYNSGRRFSGGAYILGVDPADFSVPSMPVYGDYQIEQYLKYDPTAGNVPCGLDTNGDGIGDSMCSVIPKLDADTNDRSIAAYVQDSWQIRPNLTVDLGVRWEQQTGYTAKFLQGTVAPDTGLRIPDIGFQMSDLIAPRVGVIFDPTQEGKAKVFGHWGRFYENVPMDLNVRSLGGETIRETFVGVDAQASPNNTCQVDHFTADRANAILNCPAGFTQTLGGAISYIAPNLEGQYTEEVILGAELEVLPDVTVGANYIHRSLPVVIEDMSTDGGTSYLIGNPSRNYDDAAAKIEKQAMDPSLDPALRALYLSRAAQLRAVKSFDPPSRYYDAVQLTAKKRPTSNSLLQASYTYSREKGNYPGLFSTETGQLDPNNSTQYDLPDLTPNRYGPSGLDRPHNLKVDGFYAFDFEKAGFLVLGASYRLQSGIPHNTLAAHPIYGLDESYLLPRGALYRSPAIQQLDAHVSYGYAFGRMTKLEVFADIFNLFNAQAETDADERYTVQSSLPIVGGDATDLLHAKRTQSLRQLPDVIERNLNYGKLSERQTPLTAQLGARLTF